MILRNALLTTAMFATSAYAADFDNDYLSFPNNATTAADTGLYVGATGGQMDWGFNSSGSSYGLVGGYNINETFGVEASYTSSKIDYGTSDEFGVLKGEVNFDLLGVYGTARLPLTLTSNLYLKTKLGVVHASGNTDETNTQGSETTTDSQKIGKSVFSYGVGIGYNFNKAMLELSYTDLKDKVDNTTLTLAYQF